MFNISGQPAISLPLRHSSGGLPIGVQLVAPYAREDLLFRVAARPEEALPCRDRVPPGFVGHPDARHIADELRADGPTSLV